MRTIEHLYYSSFSNIGVALRRYFKTGVLLKTFRKDIKSWSALPEYNSPLIRSVALRAAYDTRTVPAHRRPIILQGYGKTEAALATSLTRWRRASRSLRSARARVRPTAARPSSIDARTYERAFCWRAATRAGVLAREMGGTGMPGASARAEIRKRQNRDSARRSREKRKSHLRGVAESVEQQSRRVRELDARVAQLEALVNRAVRPRARAPPSACAPAAAAPPNGKPAAAPPHRLARAPPPPRPSPHPAAPPPPASACAPQQLVHVEAKCSRASHMQNQPPVAQMQQHALQLSAPLPLEVAAEQAPFASSPAASTLAAAMGAVSGVDHWSVGDGGLYALADSGNPIDRFISDQFGRS